MRTWHRARGELTCGAVYGCTIADGAPYLKLTGPGWEKKRCVVHAGYPVPDVVDVPLPGPRRPNSFMHTTELAAAVPAFYDVKRRQSGERE